MSKQIDNVTLFTDASYCPETNATAGAWWARNSSSRMRGFGGIPECTSSWEAEAATVCLAIIKIAKDSNLHLTLAQGKKARLVIVVDMLGAGMCVVQNKRVFKSERLHKLWKNARRQINAWGCYVKINHVKAHTKNDEPRFFVNSWCDHTARAHMRRLRNKYYGDERGIKP